MKLKLFSLLLVFPLLFPSALFACAPDTGPCLSPSLVDPKIVAEPFFRFEDRENWNLSYATKNLETMTLEEWKNYFSTKKKEEFGLDEVRKMIGNKTTPYPEVNAYLEFMDKPRVDSENFTVNLEAAQMAGNKKLDSFLRAKYAYHAVASAVLAEKWNQGIDYYDQLMAPLGVTSLIRYRALGWKARALVKTKQMDKAAAIYMDLFDQCPAMRNEARHSMCISEGAVKALGDLASDFKHGHRKITALYFKHLIGGRDYSVYTLNEATKYGPRESQSEMMLVRMIQDVESDFFSSQCPHLLGMPDFLPSKNAIKKFFAKIFDKRPNFADLIPVCERTAANPKTLRPAFWSWGASYLALLSGDVKTARKNLDKAVVTKAKDPSLDPSLHLMETLLQMAEKPKTFSAGTQKRFLEDLAWAQSQNSGFYKHNEDNYGAPPYNSKLEQALWALAVQKYMYMGDWARACLIASATPSVSINSDREVWSLARMDLLLDFATSAELSQLKDLLAGKESRLSSLKGLVARVTSPLEALALRQTKWTSKDMDLLMVLRKMGHFDYAGALSDLKGFLAKDPTFLETEGRPVSGWSSPMTVNFYKGTRITVKEIQFKYSLRKISDDDRQQTLELLPYLELMKSLQADLEKGRNGDKTLETKAAFDLARIYASEELTGWPEFRVSRGGYDRITPVYEYVDDCSPYFMGAILSAERGERFKQYQANTPHFFPMATKLFEEVVAFSADKEIRAQSLAYMVDLNYGNHGSYLKSLRADYQGTKFYQRYKAICSLLR